MKDIINLRLNTLALIGITVLSCKEKPRQQSTTAITLDQGTSIMNKSTIQKKEGEIFKTSLNSTLNTNDIKIAEFKIKIQHHIRVAISSTNSKIAILEKKIKQ